MPRLCRLPYEAITPVLSISSTRKSPHLRLSAVCTTVFSSLPGFSLESHHSSKSIYRTGNTRAPNFPAPSEYLNAFYSAFPEANSAMDNHGRNSRGIWCLPEHCRHIESRQSYLRGGAVYRAG